jgi:CRISPR-associated protein (TIGR03984 family)
MKVRRAAMAESAVFEDRGTVSVEYVFEDFNKLLADCQAFDYAIVYRLGGVNILKRDQLTCFDNDLLELRAFNEDSELHIIQRGDSYVGRTRTDGTGKPEVKTLDEDHKLWGVVIESDEGQCLFENRGINIVLPDKYPDGSSVFLTVRNYLAADTTRFVFDDARCVRFLCETR